MQDRTEREDKMALITDINPPAAPNLPIAPNQYSTQHFDILNNVLRLYFNRLFEVLKGLLGTGGGSVLNTPFISAYDATSQYATGNNTPTAAIWSNGDINGFTLGTTDATAQYSGTYKITYSLQFANNDNVAHDAVVWLRVNGTTSTADVPASATKFTIPARKSAGVPTYVTAYSEVVFDLNIGDSVSLWWGTDLAATSGGGTGVYMFSETAQTTPMAYPAVPSALGSITFVSAL